MKQYKKPRIKTKIIKLNNFLVNGSVDAMPMNLLAATIFPPGLCFLSGTKVLMEDGSEKEIESVKAGEIVKSYSPSSREFSQSKVEDLITHEMGEKGYVVVNDKLKVTAHHLMWANGDWKSADSLKIGDVLIDSSGKDLKVEKLVPVVGEVQTVYNLRLAGELHNYFAEGILVHNTNSRQGSLIAQNCC